MRIRSTSKKSRSGQAALLFSLMVSTILIPMVGLAIDGGRAYLVKMKLSSAVDGAALAAARLLGSGADFNAQVTNATATVKLFANANFPAKFFDADLVGDPSICVDTGADNSDPCSVNNGSTGVNTFKVRTVVVSATARMPTLFMGLIGWPSLNIGAKGVASRRDVRVVLVMDRSNSMIEFYTGGSQPAPHINDIALKFVNSFSGSTKQGRDELGLVVYGGSGIIAYPPRNVAVDYTDYKLFTPPNLDFAKSTNIPQYLGELRGGSNTGTAEALYLAYMMLRADTKTNPELSNKLNVIVLFTDGIPNGITTFANDPKLGAQPMNAGCSNRPNGSWTASPMVKGNNANMIGWFAQGGGNAFNSLDQAPHGLYPPMMAYAYTGSGNDIDGYMKNAGADTAPRINQMAGCPAGDPMVTLDSNNKVIAGAGAMKTIPQRDLYGNYTDLSVGKVPAVGLLTPPLSGGQPIYKLGSLYNTATQCKQMNFDATLPNNACQIGLASWNAAAHQAWKIWNQIVWDKATQTNIPDPGDAAGKNLSQPVIFTIGFDNGSLTDKPDLTLLQMIANDPNSPVPFSTRINGQFFFAADSTAVDRAFQQISSQILRLSQ